MTDAIAEWEKDLEDQSRAVRVDALLKLCLFATVHGEDKVQGLDPDTFVALPDALLTRAVIHAFGFSKTALDKYKEHIMKELAGMQDTFFQTPDGGMSMLAMVYDRNEVHWAEHRNAEALIALGLGIEMVSFILPREMWNAFPGSMPYIVINDEVKAFRT